MLFEPWLLRVSALHSTGVLVHCNRLPREVMRVTIPGAVKKCGDVALIAMVSGQGGGGLMVGPDDLKRSFPTLTILLFPSSPWQHWDNSNEIWQTSRSLTEKKKKKSSYTAVKLAAGKWRHRRRRRLLNPAIFVEQKLALWQSDPAGIWHLPGESVTGRRRSWGLLVW